MESETKQLSIVNIEINGGRVLINGKTYAECTYLEQKYFSELLIAMQIEIDAEKSKTKNQ